MGVEGSGEPKQAVDRRPSARERQSLFPFVDQVFNRNGHSRQAPLQEQGLTGRGAHACCPRPGFLGFALQTTSLLNLKLVLGSGGDFLFL